MRSWPSPAPRPPAPSAQRGPRRPERRARPGPPDGSRGSPAAGGAGVVGSSPAGLRAGLVTVAPTPSGPREARTLPPTRTPSAAGVLTVWDEVHGVGSSILVTGPLTSTFVDPALSGAGGRGAQQSENVLLHSHRRAPGPQGGVRPGRPGSTSVTLPLGDCEPVAPGYHHPWRLVHRSRTSDIRAITTSTTASCTTWVRSLTITFIP
jgi:hypothetical protein